MNQQTFVASPDDVYVAMVQMLQFSANFDLIHQDDASRTVTFSAVGVEGLFVAKVAEGGTDVSASTVTVTVPEHAGEAAQQTLVKFYKDLGDQLIVQGTATQAMPAEQTTVLDAQGQPTQAMPAPPEAPVASAAPAADAAAGENQSGAPTHRAPKNKFAALLTDENTGKTSTMAIVALVVSVVFLIFGFVALGMHPPVVLCIVFAVIAAVLCAAAYLNTQPGKEHGRLFTVIAAGATIVALVLSLIGATATGSRARESSSSDSSASSSAADDPFCEPISWPTAGVGAKAPKPNELKGYVWNDDADYVSIKVCNVDDAEFAEYVSKTKDNGFVGDYKSSSSDYSAKDSEGNYIDLTHYSSFGEMDVTVKSAERYRADMSEKEKKAEEEAKKQQEAQNQNAGGVTPAVKEAMDSYESYMNKYCDFMEKYNSSSDQSGMMAEYLKMMQEYSDMTQKIEGMDQSTWTDADLQYYLEVMNRVNQRLASVG